MRSFQENVGTHAGTQQAGSKAQPQANLDPRLLRTCCGNRIAPQLAEIHRPGESVLFVSVWPCPHCKRVTF